MDIAQLVADHHQAVYRYAFRLTGQVPDAEDLTQQVFLVASNKLGQLRDSEKARSWLFAILRNHFFKQCRKERPIPETDLRINIDNLPQEGGNLDVDVEQIQEALNALPDKFRVVLLMFYFEDLRYREMAEALNMPIGTVMSRLARAKSHLRSQLFDAKSAGDAVGGQVAKSAVVHAETMRE